MSDARSERQPDYPSKMCELEGEIIDGRSGTSMGVILMTWETSKEGTFAWKRARLGVLGAGG
ncbi:MAG: hypothetical protein ACREIM_06565 [Nitrospiraceae bacterium]